jgi:hypothetical protein
MHEINRVKSRTDISEPNTPVIRQYLTMIYPSIRCVFSEYKYEKFSGEVNVEPISRK